MSRLKVLALGVTGMLAIGVRPAAGQMNGPVAQGGAHPVVSHGVARSTAHSITGAPQNFNRTQVAVGPRVINSYPLGPAPSGMNPRLNYSPFPRPLNPTLSAISARQDARSYYPRSTNELLARNEFARTTPALADSESSGTGYNGLATTDMLARRRPQQSSLTATPNAFAPKSSTVPQSTADAPVPRETLQSGARSNWQRDDNRLSFSDALRSHWHECHDRDWWCRHFTTIVFVSGGYYFLDAGYWYPAFGYDPLNSYYDYDGPIYTYSNLLPDEVIGNVQIALRDGGYYFGPITGSLDVETRAALANYQRDQGLQITGATDQPTIESLGLF
jgi:Putative peptidoglycan binding domain